MGTCSSAEIEDDEQVAEKQSLHKPFEKYNPLDEDDHAIHGYIRIHFEDKFDTIFPDSLKNMIHQYSLFNTEMVTFTIYDPSIRDIVHYNMGQRGSITFNKDYKRDIICINCHGDMTIAHTSFTLSTISTNGLSLKIFARNLKLDEDVVLSCLGSYTNNGCHIDITCYSLYLSKNSSICSDKIDIQIVNDLIIGDHARIHSEGVINVNVGGMINGNGLEIKSSADTLQKGAFTSAPISFQFDEDIAFESEWGINFYCPCYVKEWAAWSNIESVMVNGNILNGKNIQLQSIDGRKHLMIDSKE